MTTPLPHPDLTAHYRAAWEVLTGTTNVASQVRALDIVFAEDDADGYEVVDPERLGMAEELGGGMWSGGAIRVLRLARLMLDLDDAYYLDADATAGVVRALRLMADRLDG